MDIPVYLVAGFLDGGKTNFINGILEDGFAREDKTLLICCEEGEEEYNPKALDNVTVEVVDDLETITLDYLKGLEKKYRPKQVIIEYNGMWVMEPLFNRVLPANWILYQIMLMVDASTFEPYLKNMGQLMMEKVMNADMIVFNRCTDETKKLLRNRNLRMVNRRADIYLENVDGTSEEYMTEDMSPFDLSTGHLDLPDDEYGIWYVDVQDHPDRYDGITIKYKALVCHSRKFKNMEVPGRFGMVCCAEDMQFLALVAKGTCLSKFKNKDWVEITATIKKEKAAPYNGEYGPVLYVSQAVATQPPKNEVVQF